ncbi:hypothetical protein HanRHA438_Chr15g0714331 [Helianthus annuus]|nr:hypothetical protein HanHA300_Chr15g0572071 [Helianthus annuus]KAJ0456533.1 hypothetical protein HanIR_Chr15g0763501 [Helianthus annuus]KAJ0473721.1 hypothetical protein HanHA89_Chr15g0621571 [Helianthus annuus]KAJ0649297.1 hypothetical protein HanLR1_Chr15g0582661 [Helianthus annuus]KAJ0845499.1 hypothetical protein HanRHA438_Chr15g0714331 [Helianthus annuus]
MANPHLLNHYHCTTTPLPVFFSGEAPHHHAPAKKPDSRFFLKEGFRFKEKTGYTEGFRSEPDLVGEERSAAAVVIGGVVDVWSDHHPFYLGSRSANLANLHPTNLKSDLS